MISVDTNVIVRLLTKDDMEEVQLGKKLVTESKKPLVNSTPAEIIP